MRSNDRPISLSTDEIQRVRQQLRTIDGQSGRVISRIGIAISHPPKPTVDSKRYRFGVALLLLAVFQMVTVLALPDDHRRWLFFGFAWLTLFIGAWHITKPKSN